MRVRLGRVLLLLVEVVYEAAEGIGAAHARTPNKSFDVGYPDYGGGHHSLNLVTGVPDLGEAVADWLEGVVEDEAILRLGVPLVYQAADAVDANGVLLKLVHLHINTLGNLG